MASARFLQVAPRRGIRTLRLSSDERVGFAGRHAQVDDARLARQPVDGVFEVFDPGEKGMAFFAGRPSGLVREIRGDVAVGKHDGARRESGFEARLGFEAVAGIEQGRKMRVHFFEGSEFAVEELRDHPAEPGIVLRKGDAEDGVAAGGESFFQQLDLRSFAAAVNPFDGDECARCHGHAESNRRARAPQRRGGRSGGATAGNAAATEAEAFVMLGFLWLTAQSTIRENLPRIQERIARAAARAGRRPEEITLVGVSKTFPAECIREAFAAGVRHFGENRVQEWEGKHGAVEDLPAKWHLVGHLQSNKAARAARLFDSVDSVDDFALAQRLDRARGEIEGVKKLRVLIEVRLVPEETKSGAGETELPALTEKVVALAQLELAGLLCIPPLFDEPERVRPYFRRLRELRDALAGRLGRTLTVLSMGMSHDFEVAIEEGATEVRVGAALFGTRAAK